MKSHSKRLEELHLSISSQIHSCEESIVDIKSSAEDFVTLEKDNLLKEKQIEELKNENIQLQKQINDQKIKYQEQISDLEHRLEEYLYKINQNITENEQINENKLIIENQNLIARNNELLKTIQIMGNQNKIREEINLKAEKKN
eukprot:c38286_g1_i1.p1 GENE.c38286_g1_i1~~c38286_g1_i1.p1  ORF type:complete len:144 (+),score=54.18 c38286_g1_i1:56-487(+)